MIAQPRRIAHLDMDAFYASVELLRYPQLTGLPVVIGGGRRQHDDALAAAYAGRLAEIPPAAFPRLKDYVGRGVITTATYAARQFGVGSAMGLMKAARLCPEALLLPVDFAEYRRYSRRFKEVILSIAPVMEDRGVDEVYIDFTQVPGGQREGGRVLARLIQKSIHEATGLTCSIGVAPNKLIAKMASAHLAAGLPQDQRHRPQDQREAAGARHPHHRRPGRAPARLAGGALRQGQRRLAARRRLGPRRAPRGDRERAGEHEPRDHLRARPARGERQGAAR
jgi:nucleotidyltransferase/DNA polymerase involved in DNA repair